VSARVSSTVLSAGAAGRKYGTKFQLKKGLPLRLLAKEPFCEDFLELWVKDADGAHLCS